MKHIIFNRDSLLRKGGSLSLVALILFGTFQVGFSAGSTAVSGSIESYCSWLPTAGAIDKCKESIRSIQSATSGMTASGKIQYYRETSVKVDYAMDAFPKVKAYLDDQLGTNTSTSSQAVTTPVQGGASSMVTPGAASSTTTSVTSGVASDFTLLSSVPYTQEQVAYVVGCMLRNKASLNALDLTPFETKVAQTINYWADIKGVDDDKITSGIRSALQKYNASTSGTDFTPAQIRGILNKTRTETRRTQDYYSDLEGAGKCAISWTSTANTAAPRARIMTSQSAPDRTTSSVTTTTTTSGTADCPAPAFSQNVSENTNYYVDIVSNIDYYHPEGKNYWCRRSHWGNDARSWGSLPSDLFTNSTRYKITDPRNFNNGAIGVYVAPFANSTQSTTGVSISSTTASSPSVALLRSDCSFGWKVYYPTRDQWSTLQSLGNGQYRTVNATPAFSPEIGREIAAKSTKVYIPNSGMLAGSNFMWFQYTSNAFIDIKPTLGNPAGYYHASGLDLGLIGNDDEIVPILRGCWLKAFEHDSGASDTHLKNTLLSYANGTTYVTPTLSTDGTTLPTSGFGCFGNVTRKYQCSGVIGHNVQMGNWVNAFTGDYTHYWKIYQFENGSICYTSSSVASGWKDVAALGSTNGQLNWDPSALTNGVCTLEVNSSSATSATTSSTTANTTTTCGGTPVNTWVCMDGTYTQHGQNGSTGAHWCKGGTYAPTLPRGGDFAAAGCSKR